MRCSNTLTTGSAVSFNQALREHPTFSPPKNSHRAGLNPHGTAGCGGPRLSQHGFTATLVVAMGPWWSRWLEDKGGGGYYLLLIRYSAFCCFSPEATTDLCSWRTHGGGGGMLLQMGTPTPSRDANRGQNWEGVVYTSWWPNIPTPACPTGVMGAVIAVGSKAAGCHHVKPGWEGVQVHAWTWFLPSLFWGGLGAKLGSSPRPVSYCRSLWLSPGLKPLLSLHAQGGPPWPTSSWGILLQEMDNPGDGSPRVPPAP